MPSSSVKPRLFIGSSSESLAVAEVLQDSLKNDADVQLWNQGIFGVSNYTLDDLLAATKEFDFAAFVFGADDTVESRGERVLTARDNVVLELGLFAGRLGRQRTFIVLQQTETKVALPTDLRGITTANFVWPANTEFDYMKLPAALAPAALALRTAMKKRGASTEGLKPLSGGMIFVALSLRDRSYTVNELGEPFRLFQNESRRISPGKAGDVYSVIAAKYACQCLEALGMAETFGGNEYALTKLGEELLASEKLQQRHAPTYATYEKLRAQRAPAISSPAVDRKP